MDGYIRELRKKVGSAPIILPGAGVILVDDLGRILLQHRTDNDCWGLPGGVMELGESFEDTARREVFEETGLTVTNLNLLCLHSGQDTYYKYPNGDEVYLAGVIFTSNDFSGEIKLQEDETADVRWFHHMDIPSNIHPNDRKPIERFISGIL